jgi:vitamin-K-epoxide reductase (warfarin-sensitive)
VRWIIALLAVLGIVAASLALREHYRNPNDVAPCNINDKWDCGAVNKSPQAVIAGVPVAVIGIVGYLLLAILALARARMLLMIAALIGLGFSLYLTHIEADVLQIWCIYCVASLSIISSISLLSVIMVLLGLRKKAQEQAPA